MQLNNEIHNPESEHAAVSLKVILLIFSIILVGVLGYLVWDYQATPDTTDYSVPKLTNNAEQSEEVASQNLVACGDEAYAFELTFSNDWNGYTIKEVTPDYALVTCYFTMPTTSTDTVWTTAAIDHDAKYASIFAISVYTIAQWTTALEESNPPTQLGFDGTYYWGWGQAQAIPTDLEAVYADAKNIVATFKIAP